jgi:HPt (histidine-containing phosphotransfer) domain-containing protein
LAAVANTGVQDSFDETTLRGLLELGLSRESMHSYIKEALQDIASALQRVHKAADAVDRIGLRDASHALKGVAMNVGATRLAHACNERLHAPPGREAATMRKYATTVDALAKEAQDRLPLLIDSLMPPSALPANGDIA